MNQIQLARRKLGRSDLLVSELCLGTLNFGWHTGEPAAFEIMDAFHAAGGNFIQACGLCSDEDFGPGSTGVSETYVGRWLRARGIPRDEVVIASRHSPGLDTKRRDVFATASEIRRMCEESLRRLQVRYLDLLVLEWSENMAMDETLLGAETLIRAGMVRHIAASGFPAWRVMEWIGHSSRRNLCRFEAMQGEFSVVSNAAVNGEALDLARVHRLGFVARSPLAGGLLTGRFASEESPLSARSRRLRGRCSSGKAAAALAEITAIAGEKDATAARVALAWVLAHPAISSALIGVNSLAQFDDLCRAAALGLSISEIQRLDWRWRAGESHQDHEHNAPEVWPLPLTPGRLKTTALNLETTIHP